MLRALSTMVVELLSARGAVIPSELSDARDALSGPMSDDASEEDTALEYANANLCEPGVCFELDCGDLMLTKDFAED